MRQLNSRKTERNANKFQNNTSYLKTKNGFNETNLYFGSDNLTHKPNTKQSKKSLKFTENNFMTENQKSRLNQTQSGFFK